MIKSDLGKLHAPYYSQRLDNGLAVVFLPRQGHLRTAVLSVPTGAYPHDNTIDGSKIPAATAYLVKETILSERTKEQLKALGTVSKPLYDFSYTAYELETLGDIFVSVQALLDKIRGLDFPEEDIEAFKQSHAQTLRDYHDDPMHQVESRTLHNLFLESPLADGMVPDNLALRSVHHSTVTKYVRRYYQAPMMTLYIAGDFRPDDVLNACMALKVPGQKTVKSDERKSEEDFTKVRLPYDEFEAESDGNYLSFAVKLRKREDLYNAYGNLTFAYYEVLMTLGFTENPQFLEGVRKADADLVDARLIQGYEETAVLLTFRTLSSGKILRFLTDYVAHMDNHITHKDFSRGISRYYAKALRTLSLPNTALEAFVFAACNNDAYTGLVSDVSRISFGGFRTFLSQEMTKAGKTSVYLMAKTKEAE